MQFADKSTEIKEQGSDYKLTKILKIITRGPPDITLYDYQKEAVGAWEQKAIRVYSTWQQAGKTITGLADCKTIKKSRP